MNIGNRFRRVIVVVVLASSLAGAVVAAGAAHADDTATSEPVPTEVPAEPATEEAPPGATPCTAVPDGVALVVPDDGDVAIVGAAGVEHVGVP